MKLIFFLMSLVISISAMAFPSKFQGHCQEVGQFKKRSAMVGIELKDFPGALTVIDENGKTTLAVAGTPTRMNPNVDQYVVLENITTHPLTQFSLIYYGNLYADSPYFFEMTVSYSLDLVGSLRTHQLQTTYYQGQVSKGNEWICEYQQYYNLLENFSL